MFLPFVFVDPFRHVCADKSRSNGIDSHFLFGYLLCQCLRCGYYATFGSGIVGLSCHSLYARQRHDVDNTSVSLDQHIFQQWLCHVEETVQTDIEHFAPFFACHPEHQIIFADTGIVHKHFDILVGVPGIPFSQSIGDGGRVSYVEFH